MASAENVKDFPMSEGVKNTHTLHDLVNDGKSSIEPGRNIFFEESTFRESSD